MLSGQFPDAGYLAVFVARIAIFVVGTAIFVLGKMGLRRDGSPKYERDLDSGFLSLGSAIWQFDKVFKFIVPGGERPLFDIFMCGCF